MKEVVLEEFLKAAAVKISTILADKAASGLFRGHSTTEELSNELLQSYGRAIRWASQFQFYGMTSPRDLEEATIDLEIADVPRKFRRAGAPSERVSESDLLESGRSVLVLGDPGAGKTTTVKRMVRATVSREEVAYPWPIAVVLRDVDSSNSLVRLIGMQLGLTSEEDLRTADAGDVPSRPVPVPGETERERARKVEAWRQAEERHQNEMRVRIARNDGQLLGVVAAALDELNALVLVDGIDEVSTLGGANVFAQLESLDRSLNSAKIVATCRSGGYEQNIVGFDVHELLPLEESQVQDIVDRWLGTGNTFLRTARLGQSSDLLTRPLFLVQMLNLFESCGGVLPYQPWAASRQMARLLLEEWDRRHGLSRTSKYYRFGSEEKLEFLSSLAFELLSEEHVRFDHSQLSLAYSRICSRFGLAARDRDTVLMEIEAHNGLIVQSGVESFEFSHLSIQEVLAADHILRLPSLEPRSMQRLPAVVAVATAMSSVPSSWFASVVLHQSSFQKANSMEVYLSRVVAERPFWERSLELGAALMRLMVVSNENVRAAVRSIVEDPLAARSLLDALDVYEMSEDVGGIRFRARDDQARMRFGPRPVGGLIPNESIPVADVGEVVGRLEYLRSSLADRANGG